MVCPTHLTLTDDIRRATAGIQELADERASTERARFRFEARNERLDKGQRTRDGQLAQQKETAKQVGRAAIAEILKRAQEKRDEREVREVDKVGGG